MSYTKENIYIFKFNMLLITSQIETEIITPQGKTGRFCVILYFFIM